MAKVTMGLPVPGKKESGLGSQDMSSAFKSLKRSLQDTLERLEQLETIGINDSDAGDEISRLKLELSEKNKIIEKQAAEMDALRHVLSRTGNQS